METPEWQESSLKELPTRELKLRRNKDRRDSPTIPPIRLRLKSNTSPLNSETETERGFSDRSISSSPDSMSQDLSPVFISSSSYKTCSRVNSSPSSPITNKLYDEPCETAHLAQQSSSNYNESENYDQPLDMSRKRSQEIVSSEAQSFHHQQHRPSVITCASALLRTQCNLSDLPHQMCTAHVSDSNSNDAGNNHCETYFQNNKDSRSNGIENVRPGHRREIVSGSCDPVIDEHFRRSLGKDYQQIFSKSTANSVSITVDDHFAKALGDTWHQLQQSKTVTASVSPIHANSSLQSQQQTQFIHQPSEIMS